MGHSKAPIGAGTTSLRGVSCRPIPGPLDGRRPCATVPPHPQGTMAKLTSRPPFPCTTCDFGWEGSAYGHVPPPPARFSMAGNVGILKSFLAEITDSTNRGRAFSLMPLAWGLGCVFAPMAGGLLSRPAIQYPGIPWGIFETFPYLLPCCVALLLQGVTVLLVIFLMVEPENDSRSGSALFKSPSSKASLASPRSGSPLLKDPESPVQELESPVEGSVDAVPSWPPGRVWSRPLSLCRPKGQAAGGSVHTVPQLTWNLRWSNGRAAWTGHHRWRSC